MAESETLVNALHQTPLKGKPKSVVHTLAELLEKIKSEKLGDTLNDVKPKPLVETLRLQTVGVMLMLVQVKTVIDKLASKLIKENAKTVGHKRCHLETRLW